uniref:Cytochrome P450 n=1 Tax=Panagrolaimus superbus TaxID=310955 RepID=A0A914Y9I2_9BILA
MIIKRDKETFEDKEKRQQDFIDFLRESQEEIDTSGDSNLMLREPKKLTREEVIGTALLFLIAGSDTTSNLVGFSLYELARNPEYQYMILQEIKDCIETEVSEVTADLAFSFVV